MTTTGSRRSPAADVDAGDVMAPGTHLGAVPDQAAAPAASDGLSGMVSRPADRRSRLEGPNRTDSGDAVQLVMARTRELLDPALRSWVAQLPGPIHRVVAYHLGWSDAQGGAGKVLRPALAFAAAEAVGDRAQQAIGVAVAVELVHNFSLLHDDIIDRDITRRHRPTAWTVFGVPDALLAGDALLGLAHRVLADGPLPAPPWGVAWLAEAVQQLIAGEQQDLALETRADVTLQECLAMSRAKTGVLLGCACALGALAGGAAGKVVEDLRCFGHHLGLAFQLTDDLLGIWGYPRITGKPAGADLIAGKKSLPVTAAITSATTAGTRLRQAYAAPSSAIGPADLAVLVDQAGGRAWAERTAQHELARALACLDRVDPPEHARTTLSALAGLAAYRDH